MMARGGGIGGCWASFSPSWFLEPRPLSSCSTLSLSSHPSSSLSLMSLISLLSPSPLLRSPRLNLSSTSSDV